MPEPPAPRLPWGALLAVFAALLAGAVLFAVRAHDEPGLPVYFGVPKFTLTDQDGRRVTDTDLRGHVWVVDFVFTGCTTTCPELGSRYYELAELFPGDVKLVSITVDPDRDTPAVMREYMTRHYKSDLARWWWLTGDKRTIYDLMQHGFKVGEPDAPTATDIPHTPLILLVDARGRVRGSYDGTDYEGTFKTRLIPDLRALHEAQKPLRHARRLSAVNAALNATSALLLSLGLVLIRLRRSGAHQACMLATCFVSLLFLASYAFYHLVVGSVRFAGEGWVRPVYFGILLSHTVLALTIVPLAVVTLARGLGGRFDRHRAIAKWTLPLWLYVSVTGVIVYVLLYVAYPGR